MNFFYPVKVKVFGGEGGPASTLAPKLGPLGLVIRKIKFSNPSFFNFQFYKFIIPPYNGNHI